MFDVTTTTMFLTFRRILHFHVIGNKKAVVVEEFLKFSETLEDENIGKYPKRNATHNLRIGLIDRVLIWGFKKLQPTQSKELCDTKGKTTQKIAVTFLDFV